MNLMNFTNLANYLGYAATTFGTGAIDGTSKLEVADENESPVELPPSKLTAMENFSGCVASQPANSRSETLPLCVTMA